MPEGLVPHEVGEKVKAEVERLLLEWGEQVRKEQDLNPPPVVVRLRKLKGERQKTPVA